MKHILVAALFMLAAPAMGADWLYVATMRDGSEYVGTTPPEGVEYQKIPAENRIYRFSPPESCREKVTRKSYPGAFLDGIISGRFSGFNTYRSSGEATQKQRGESTGRIAESKISRSAKDPSQDDDAKPLASDGAALTSSPQTAQASAAQSSQGTQKGPPIAYVSRSGDRYHLLESCSSGSSIPVYDKSELAGKTPCRKCWKGEPLK